MDAESTNTWNKHLTVFTRMVISAVAYLYIFCEWWYALGSEQFYLVLLMEMCSLESSIWHIFFTLVFIHVLRCSDSIESWSLIFTFAPLTVLFCVSICELIFFIYIIVILNFLYLFKFSVFVSLFLSDAEMFGRLYDSIWLESLKRIIVKLFLLSCPMMYELTNERLHAFCS